MFSRNFYWILSGGDKTIIRQCALKTQVQFTLLGFFVFIILLLCFISSWFSFQSLFHSQAIGIGMACFFATVIFNLFMLLQTTISRNFLPVPEEKITSRLNKQFSLAIRIGFIVFLAIIVSKPIEEMMFSSFTDVELEQFKAGELQRYRQSADRRYNDLEQRISASIRQYEQIRDFDKVSELTGELQQSRAERDTDLVKIQHLIGQSDYFIHRIRILCTSYPVSWVITTLFVCIFLAPVIIKFIISGKESQYHRYKCLEDQSIITNHYHELRKRYPLTFLHVTGKKINLEEKYHEPPFNVSRIKDEHTFSSQDDLLALLYGK